VSQSARTSPVGPAPTINTSAGSAAAIHAILCHIDGCLSVIVMTPYGEGM
jgi:hypothetical protein